MGIGDKKKLLITCSTFPRWKTDTEPRFIFDYAEAMNKYFDVTVIAPAAPNAREHEKMSNVNVIRYHYFPIHRWETLCYPGAIVPRIREKKIRVILVPFLFLSLYFHLIRILPEYDIVHAHWLIPQGIVQSFIKSKPYIVTGHGGDVTSLNKGVLRQFKNRCLRNAKYVTVVSEHLRGYVKRIVPEINPYVISMGVNLKNFGRQYYVPDYFGQGDKKVVLFVGRLVEKKGVTYLIEAMKQIDAVLVIVGDGPLRNELQEQTDLFVAPSVTATDGDQEGLPTTIMEAMASGLPVVASKSGGIAQMIKDGVNGLLCEEKCVGQLVDNICSLLNDEDLYQKVVKGGDDTIKEYDYDNIAQKYNEIMKRIM